MIGRWAGAPAAVLCCVAMLSAPHAHAVDAITYEVVSDSVSVLNVEYVDRTGRRLMEDVPLPWRLDVTLDDAAGPPGRGAQIRADWRPVAAPSRWVVVSIYGNGSLRCRSTLDVGNATCYGNTPTTR